MMDPKDLLAAERTLLAWIRTGIALMGFGFVVARFGVFLRELARLGNRGDLPQFDGVLIGTAMVAAGVWVNLWASLRHRHIDRQLRAGVKDISSTGPIAVGVASALGGLVLVAVLATALLR